MQISDYDVFDLLSDKYVMTVAVESEGSYAAVNEVAWSQITDRFGAVRLSRTNSEEAFRLLRVPGNWPIARLERSSSKHVSGRCPRCRGEPKFVRTALMCCGQVLGGF